MTGEKSGCMAAVVGALVLALLYSGCLVAITPVEVAVVVVGRTSTTPKMWESP